MASRKRSAHCFSHVRQNVAVTVDQVPRSGERSNKAMNDPGLRDGREASSPMNWEKFGGLFPESQPS
jgi:hypothetical protein